EWVKPLAPRLQGGGFWPTQWPALAPERTRFVGEPVAALCAESPAQAVDACDLVEVDYGPLPALADAAAALAPGAPLLPDDVPGTLLCHRGGSQGDVDGAFARAAVVVRETFRHGRCSASPLEARGIVASWQRGRLTVWTGTQAPHIVRVGLARAFDLPEDHVQVIVPDTGAGFRQKIYGQPAEPARAALAKITGRPVKWIETRRENLAAASQAREGRVEIEAAADREGVLLALRTRVISDNGAYHIYPLTAALEPPGTASIIPGPYRLPAYAWEALAVATNKPPLGAYRGVGMTMGAFVMERTLDLLARSMGLDPAEIRRRNLLQPGDYPATSPSGFVYDSGDYPRALARALDLIGYARRCAERAAVRRRGRLLGVGLSCYTEFTGIGTRTYRQRGMVEMPGAEAARLRLDADGGVTCRVSFPSQGQGHATTVAQIVADQIGVKL